MKVLCINGDFSNVSDRAWFKYLKEVPIELNDYTVIETVKRLDKIGYILEEVSGGIFPNGQIISFDSSRFLIIQSDEHIKETNLCEKEWEKNLELI